ncbi:MAG TPA: acetyl-CoA acetyltransferase [Pseudomonadales bacterium]|nr:acetyl-CoA acetyltransferase [Pseudomonadales bacterium]
MNRDNTPILIGVGQVTEKEEDLAKVSSPMELMEQATWQAFDDAGIARERVADVDVLAVVRSFRESTPNSPEALARRLGASKAEQWLMPNGGNGPQYLVNRYCEAIAKGEARFCLFSGAEAIDNLNRLTKAGIKPDWEEPATTERRYLVSDKRMSTPLEDAHGMMIPSNAYPLYENALRGHYGESIEAHQRTMGELFARFSEVAATHPQAWYPIARTAAEIATATPQNRYVGWPYTKFMNAMNMINQSATLLLTSVAFAREMGVAEDKWVYLHGCADASELWYLLDRENYHSSVAIRTMGRKTLEMAGRSIDEVDFIDLYSCFPSAVQIARDELGIAKDDPRPLTITGGLPFHGGAGNNYVMNSIASMVDVVRANAGKFGLVTANGGYLTKHAAGLYSTTPTEVAGEVPFVREDPAAYQAEIDATPHPEVVERPDGEATVETYTVLFGREGTPQGGIVVGRDARGRRFCAVTPQDESLLTAMTREDFLGRAGTVSAGEKQNLFSPAL